MARASIALAAVVSSIRPYELPDLAVGAIGIFSVAFAVLIVATMTGLFQKMGLAKSGALVPVYNLYLIVKELDFSGLFFISLLIPGVNIVSGFVLCFEIAKRFEKEWSYSLGLLLVPFVFFPMLVFSADQYIVEKKRESFSEKSSSSEANTFRAKSQTMSRVLYTNICDIDSMVTTNPNNQPKEHKNISAS